MAVKSQAETETESDKAAGYVRVSTEQQKDDNSHERQERRLREWADENGYSIEIFDDVAVSGQSDDREQYAEMMTRIDEFDLVLVRELSRFGRSVRKVVNDIYKMKEKHDTEFMSISEQQIDTTGAHGRLLLNQIAAFNQFWSDLAQERAEEIAQRRKEEGLQVGRAKKLNEDQMERVDEWRRRGISYGNIAELVELNFGIEISDQTIYRYCRDRGVEIEL